MKVGHIFSLNIPATCRDEYQSADVVSSNTFAISFAALSAAERPRKSAVWTEVSVTQVEESEPQLENQPADTEDSRQQQRERIL